jgi:hypothetical protein
MRQDLHLFYRSRCFPPFFSFRSFPIHLSNPNSLPSSFQFNNYLDELAIPSTIATAGGRNTDRALAHTYENTRDFLRKGFGMQVGPHMLFFSEV